MNYYFRKHHNNTWLTIIACLVIALAIVVYTYSK